MHPSLEPRLFDLEVRVAHHEKTITELNDVITGQWKRIDMLERQLRHLVEEMDALATVEAPAANQKPPHY